MISSIERDPLGSVFDVLPFGVYLVDIEGLEIVFMNRTLTARFGDLTGQICYRALFGEERPCHHCTNRKIVAPDGTPNGRFIAYEHFNPMDDRWYQVHDKALTWFDGRTVKCSIVVDISEIKEMQNRLVEAHAELALKNRALRAMSRTDPLTSVANRLRLDEVFVKEIDRAMRHGRPFAIIILDLDHFKDVNDTHGHQVGDEVLKTAARLVDDLIRETDVLGRWGGEEFLVVSPETDLARALDLAERIRRGIEDYSFEVAGRVTASLGVAAFQTGDTTESLLSRADTALYQAKHLGRNRVEPTLPV